jgi:hypothetical protein
MWTPFGCLMSYKIRPIISVICDFTTKSGGIWEGEDELDKRVGVAQEPNVGCLIVEIDGDRTVFACQFGSLSHVSPSVQLAVGAEESS